MHPRRFITPAPLAELRWERTIRNPQTQGLIRLQRTNRAPDVTAPSARYPFEVSERFSPSIGYLVR